MSELYLHVRLLIMIQVPGKIPIFGWAEKNISTNWTNPGIFDIWICINLDSYCQKLIFRESTGHSSVSIKFWDFLFLFESLKIVSLTYFDNSRDTLYLEFATLDITYRFTCRKLNFHGNALNCKDIMSLL